MLNAQSSLACAAALLVAAACTKAPPPARTAPEKSEAPASHGRPDEPHLSELRQLTFGGENAEAYWAWDGRSLILQARVGDAQCDRIYRLPLGGPDVNPLVPLSNGKGATTCSYFLPGNEEFIYASTELGGDACPPKPDHSQGYVWALYPSYDIFRQKLDGSGKVRLTDAPGYDAEGTVCGKDGSIVFTSVRDGDLELYRMDADGKNVKRLTHSPGYDGGAFFSADCSHIVWRASRPRPGKELEDYQRLLSQHLVRPSKLELYVARADGSEATQITYLDAATFAPYFFPSGKRVLFSSNVGDPKGREFDLYAVNIDGTDFERVTTSPGFDGFPMFSPDGKELAFSSNRATAPGARDTNVFVARWLDDSAPKGPPSAADRVMRDVRYLSDPAREGRGVATRGLADAGAYVEQRLRELGLAPAGDQNGYRQSFEVKSALAVGPDTAITIAGKQLSPDDFVPLGFSPSRSDVTAELVGVGHGISDPALGLDQYAGKNVKGKIAVVRRFVPDRDTRFASLEAKRRYGDLRYKAWLAKERGAVGMLVIDDPVAVKPTKDDPRPEAQAEAPLPPLTPEGYGDAGLPALVVRRSALPDLLARLDRRERPRATLRLSLAAQKESAFNVVGRIAARPADGRVLPGAIVLGAHYDHLGLGGRYSLSPDVKAAHVGADDNASGVAALLEIARALAADPSRLRRDVVIAAFSAEESGLLGSAHFVRAAEQSSAPGMKPKELFAMVNFDMVGRLRDNRLQVLGADTAKEWRELLEPACDEARIQCAPASDGGFGPSDQMSFFVAGVPVLHFFTGSHADYHKPTDTPDKVNGAGAAQIAELAASLTRTLSAREARLTHQANVAGPAPRGDLRSFNATLGTIPDYGGPGAGKPGVLLGGVRPGSAAEKAGLERGDVLIRIGKHSIRSIEDFMFVLNSSQPGQTTTAGIVRDGKELSLEITFEARGERMR